MSSDQTLPFRLILILADGDDPVDLIDRAARLAPLKVAVMLRDSRHRRSRVQALYNTLSNRPTPENVTLILNGILDTLRPSPAVWCHLPTHMLTGELHERPTGGSIHSLDQLLRAESCGVSYTIASPVHDTPSKPGVLPLKLHGLRQLAERATLPLFALGGIDDQSKAREALDAGAYGVAGIRLGTEAYNERLSEVASQLLELHSIGRGGGG